MTLDRFAFEQSPDPIFRINANGDILDVNLAACQGLGYARDELLGCRVWEINPAWSSEHWDGIWQSLSQQPLGYLIATLSHRDGTALAFELQTRPLPLTQGTEAILYAHERIPQEDDFGELQRLRELLNVAESISQIGHWRLNVETGRPQWSKQVFAIFRRDPTLGEPSFDEHERYVSSDDWPRLREAVRNCSEQGIPYAITLDIRRDDGSTGTARVYGSALPKQDSDSADLVGFVLDISEQAEIEKHLIRTQQRLDIALDASGTGVYWANIKTGEAGADARYLAMLGYAPDEIVPTIDWWRAQLHPDDAVATLDALERAICGDQDGFQGEYRMRHRNGHWTWIEDHGRICERDPSGRGQLSIGVHLDISQRKRAERKLNYRANHDRLTSLLNRYSFWCALRRVHAQSQRSQQPYCIAMLDLDLFKAINDTYGHSVGDAVLKGFAKQLRQSVREADWTARWGGEEFIVLMPETRWAQAQSSMERFRIELAATELGTSSQPLKITLSIGIAESNGQDDTPDMIITRADNALYQAKRQGRNRVCYVEMGRPPDHQSTEPAVPPSQPPSQLRQQDQDWPIHQS
ncbi:MAG: diguanylate cyclase [Lamprobacter sp.]|uniref:GGDEF domain-containing protein n=1 Tax=Lamprobacter sp. TaxID=3100796 RepID=UPI002B25D295|nr:diguanylate cyclase [Lamprobacter sp.]MEA3642196.1 diguanylate cyclase [Lamprobacter sp.]